MVPLATSRPSSPWTFPSLIGLVLLAVLAAGLLAAGPGLLVVGFKLLDARHRAYARLYEEIETGMTRDQVWAAVERVYPADGVRTRPTIVEDSAAGLSFFMHPEGEQGPNCEGIFLKLRDGVVVERAYCAD